MLRGKLPINVKAILCVASNQRIEGEELTPFVLEHALNNREQFTFIYLGDIVEPARTLEPDPPKGSPLLFTESILKGMNKGALQDLCSARGIPVEGEPTISSLVKLILVHQDLVKR